MSFLLAVLLSTLFFFPLPGYGNDASPDEPPAPVIIWRELFATVEALYTLGIIRRDEFIYYHEHLKFASDGLEYWGAPFRNLLIEPNFSEERKWDYRVIGGRDDFTIIARRRSAEYTGREIRLNREGQWSGNYPFWPIRFPLSTGHEQSS